MYNAQKSEKQNRNYKHTRTTCGIQPRRKTEYWEEIDNITKQINKNDCISWRADNNGKIGKNVGSNKIGNGYMGKLRKRE